MNKADQEEQSIIERSKRKKPEVNYEYLNMSFWVRNHTETHFSVIGKGLEKYCKWAEAPKSILPKSKDSNRQLPFRSCGNAHLAAGTEGWVRFRADDRDAEFLIQWDVPLSGAGYLTCESTGRDCGYYVFRITNYEGTGSYDPSSPDPNPMFTIKPL